jgi:peptide/nickel transport system ATP-binding protein
VESPPPFTVSGGHDVRCFEWRETPSLARSTAAGPIAGSTPQPVLAAAGLTAAYGDLVVVDDVSFELGQGECLALVGESGSGKTTVARCVAGLHAPLSGSITLGGVALAASARKRTRDQRRRLQIVFQNPYDSLNPRRRIADQIARPAELLRGLSRADARARVDELLARVRLPARIAERFPAELSGGERQRVAIARALAADPDVVVCDEVTSALDVSVQAAVLELLEELRAELGVALLFITHDLGVVGTIADRVLVLEQGRVCEGGPTARVLDEPEAEYTRRLLAAAPRLPEPGA